MLKSFGLSWKLFGSGSPVCPACGSSYVEHPLGFTPLFELKLGNLALLPFSSSLVAIFIVYPFLSLFYPSFPYLFLLSFTCSFSLVLFSFLMAANFSWYDSSPCSSLRALCLGLIFYFFFGRPIRESIEWFLLGGMLKWVYIVATPCIYTSLYYRYPILKSLLFSLYYNITYYTIGLLFIRMTHIIPLY